MAQRIISFEGRRIGVPDDATPDDIRKILSQPAPARPPPAAVAPADDTSTPEGFEKLRTQRRDELNDIGMTVASEAVRAPSYIAGAAKGVLGATETVGTAIGDFARYLTGKEARDTSVPVADPLGVRTATEALPSGEELRTAASDVTGITLHDPTTTPGKVAQYVVPGLGAARGIAKGVGLIKKTPANAPAYVPMATSPRNPVIKGAIDTAKTEASATGKQVAQTLPPQIKAILADPAAMARFTPAEQAILQDVARNGWTQSTVTQIGRLGNPRSVLALAAALHTGTGSLIAAQPFRRIAAHFNNKNVKILNGIVGLPEEVAPAAARAAPAAEAASVAPRVPPARPAPPAATVAPRVPPARPAPPPAPEPGAPVAEAPPAPADPAAKLDAISAAPPRPPTPAEGDFAAALDARRYNVAGRPTKPIDREAQATLDRLRAIREGGDKPLPKPKAKAPTADVVLPEPKSDRWRAEMGKQAKGEKARQDYFEKRKQHKSYGGATAHFKNTVAKHAKRKSKSDDTAN